jgi:hypothetical protein
MQSNKKTYTKPQIVVHGNVEEITLARRNEQEWEKPEKKGPPSGFHRDD